MQQFGQPRYRAGQLLDAMFRKRLGSLEEVTTFPRGLRQQMTKAGWSIDLPEIEETFQASDGTERYLIACDDGRTVETVWMPEGDGGERGDGRGDDREPAASPGPWRRATICVSSQIGCAVNCRFCLTARLGIERNLDAGEIAGQVIAVLRRHAVEVKKGRVNLVFMGMGEPFLNYDSFMSAVQLLAGEAGLSESRMTVSTSGIVPGILRFAREPVRPKLAISLNAADDETRERIMPVTRKWKIEDVLGAAAEVPLKPREKITLEYVLLSGVNDSMKDAEGLARLARRAPFPVKVNLIAWNPGPGLGFEAPGADHVAAFQQRVIQSGIPAFLRRPRGQDIFAACGQLKRTERPLAGAEKKTPGELRAPRAPKD